MTRRLSLPVKRGAYVPLERRREGIALERNSAGEIVISLHHIEGDILTISLGDQAADMFASDLATMILADPQLADNDR